MPNAAARREIRALEGDPVIAVLADRVRTLWGDRVPTVDHVFAVGALNEYERRGGSLRVKYYDSPAHAIVAHVQRAHAPTST